LVASEDVTPEVIEQLGRCFRVEMDRRDSADELEKAFEFHTDQAIRAIQSGRSSDLHAVLDTMREAIEVALPDRPAAREPRNVRTSTNGART
jgi:hypothetical protein